MSPRQSQGSADNVAAAGVRVIENAWVPLPDGVRLAVRIWMPQDAAERPVSAVLDSVPYRKADGTAIGDAAWGTYFAAHGLAFVRLDLRGSGDSEGILEDEYTEQEQRDVEQVISWIGEQPWCSGAVGMIGVSWGGFAALQLAARHPDRLRGVVAIHASDDRYADDVHYIGGCVSALDMTQWATSMLAYINQPPDPAVAGESWRAAWHARLDQAQPWIAHWLDHQRRDAYWRQGSACEDYAAIHCPVFAVGGWSDGYRDMVLRVVENVHGPVRGLIGPWGHTRPERGAPGPAIGFLQECVRFFAAALDGADNGFWQEPRLITFMQEAVAPAGGYAHRPGRWVADPAWPSPSVQPLTLTLGDARLLAQDEPGPGDAPRGLRGLQGTGVDGGVWCGDGSPADFGLDQRPDDGASLCWESPALDERLELLGQAEARLRVSVDQPSALLAVRICDVAPDGTSTLVARGLLNLTRREGHDRTTPMPTGETVTVGVRTQSTAYAVPAGHRVRLAISPTYWPLAWPSPDPVLLTVHGGELVLPRRAGGDLEPAPFGVPESGPELGSETTQLRPGGRRVHRNLATGEIEVKFHWHDARTRIRDTDTEMGERNVATYRIVEGDPLSATVTCEVETTLVRPGVLDTRTVASSVMTCDRERFTVTSTLEAFDDGVRVHAATHTHHFDRDGA